MVNGQALIHPVPDGSTHDAGVGIDHIPVLLQIATGITHRMGIFAHHKGFVADFPGLPTQILRIEITVVPDGRVAAVAVVEGWAGAVQFAYLIIHSLDVRSYTALVAQTPKDDTRMVEVALYQRLSPVHMGLLECQVFAHHLIGIAIAVGLVVGLVHHIDAPTVTELVEVFAVGIVRGAQEVDVRLLHQSDILFVGGIIHIAARLRMVVVTVHTAQLHVLAVDLEHLAHNFDLLHTEVVGKFFVVLAILHAKQLQGEGIEPRLLGRPQMRWGIVLIGEFYGYGIASRQFWKTLVGNIPMVRIDVDAIQFRTSHLQLHQQVFCGFLACIAYRNLSIDGKLRVVGIGHRRHLIVGYMHQRPYPQLHAAEDAR